MQGIKAAKGEERFGKTLQRNRNVLGFWFRLALGAPRGVPGWLELDYLVHTFSGYRAFEIDNMEFVHKGQREAAETKLKDNRRMKGLSDMGIVVAEIEHIDEAKLRDFEGAKRVQERLRL